MQSLSESFLRFIHPLVLKVLSMTSRMELQIEGNIPDDGKYIFVANHFCIDDIPTAGQIIKRHFFVLVSDEDKWTPNGLALSLNGVVWTNRLSKTERKRSAEKLISLLNNGHSILMYPEATWNLSPNLLMLPMNCGYISLSLETSTPIIPVYLFFEDNICKARIGKPFYPSNDKVKSNEKLRDEMATLAWHFICQNGITHRQEMDDDYWKNNIAKRYSNYARAKKDPEGVRAFESQFIFQPKGITPANEVFAHLNSITPSKDNAFLWRRGSSIV